DQHLQLVPLVLLLLLDGVVPQDARGQAARPGQAEADDAADQLDLPARLLADGQLVGQAVDDGPPPPPRPADQDQDQADVDQLALTDLLLIRTRHVLALGKPEALARVSDAPRLRFGLRHCVDATSRQWIR